jgi:uncharacterized protein YkwD
MKTIILVTALLFTTIAFPQGDSDCPTGQEKVEAIDSSIEKEILRLVNIERAKENLPPLKWHDELGYAARYHAKDMAVDNYFEHDSYDRQNGDLVESCETFTRIRRFFVSGTTTNENLSAGSNTAEATVKRWMESPGHRGNILSSKSKFVGIGYYNNEDSEWTHYYVQCFGY